MYKNYKEVISIIVPIYNVGKYLTACLESINRQTFKDYEVIMVENSSTDNSLQIAQEFANKYEKFKLIEYKEKKGVAHARKKAIEISNGEYLAFLDGDDTMEPQFLKKMYKTLVATNVDMVYCNYRLVNDKTKSSIDVRIRKPFAGIMSGRKLAKLTVADFRGRSYLWNKLWKKSLFESENLIFPDMCYEDIALSSLLIHQAKKVVVINDILINYTVNREGSIVFGMSEEKVNDYHSTLYIIREFLEKENDFTYYKIAFFRLAMAMFFSIPYNVGRVEVSFKEKLKITKYALKDIFIAMSPKYIEHKEKYMPKLLKEENKLIVKNRTTKNITSNGKTSKNNNNFTIIREKNNKKINNKLEEIAV